MQSLDNGWIVYSRQVYGEKNKVFIDWISQRK